MAGFAVPRPRYDDILLGNDIRRSWPVSGDLRRLVRGLRQETGTSQSKCRINVRQAICKRVGLTNQPPPGHFHSEAPKACTSHRLGAALQLLQEVRDVIKPMLGRA